MAPFFSLTIRRLTTGTAEEILWKSAEVCSRYDGRMCRWRHGDVTMSMTSFVLARTVPLDHGKLTKIVPISQLVLEIWRQTCRPHWWRHGDVTMTPFLSRSGWHVAMECNRREILWNSVEACSRYDGRKWVDDVSVSSRWRHNFSLTPTECEVVANLTINEPRVTRPLLLLFILLKRQLIK